MSPAFLALRAWLFLPLLTLMSRTCFEEMEKSHRLPYRVSVWGRIPSPKGRPVRPSLVHGRDLSTGWASW